MKSSFALVAALVLAAATPLYVRAQIPGGHFVSAHFGSSTNGAGGLWVTHPRTPGNATPITGLPFDLVGPVGGWNAGANAIAAMPDGSLVVGMLGTALNAPVSMVLYHLDVAGTTASVRRAVTIGTLAPGQRGQTAQIELAGPGLVVFSGSLTGGPTPLGPPGALNGNMLGLYDPNTGAVTPIAMTPPPGGLVGSLNALASDGATVWFAMYCTSTLSNIYSVPIGGGAATFCAAVAFGVTGMDLDGNGDILVLGTGPLTTINPATGGVVATCAPHLGSSLAYDPVSGTLAHTTSWVYWNPLIPCSPRITLAMPPAAGWGLPAGITIMPNPTTFGDPSPAGGPGYRWVVPPGAGGPVAGNTAFALSCVDATGAPAGAASAWILGLGPAAPPIPFCGAVLLTDPATWFANGPFGPTGTLPLSISPTTGLVGYTLWFQSVHLWGTCLASGDALSMTIL